MNLLTQTELAAELGLSQQRISAMIRKGQIPDTCLHTVHEGGKKRRKIDPECARKAIEENIDKHARDAWNSTKGSKDKTKTKKQKPIKKPVSHDQVAEAVNRATKTEPGRIGKINAEMSYAEANRLQSVYKAALLAMDVALRQGSQHDTNECKKAAFEIGRLTRDTVMGVPARISSIVAAEMDSFKCEKIIADELRAAFEKVVSSEES